MLSRCVLLVWMCLVTVVGMAQAEDAGETASCASGDGREWLRAGRLCLGVETFGADNVSPRPQLVVMIHGDSSQGGPVDYFYPIAKQVAAEPDVVAVALLRPGYSDGAGKVSDGRNWGRVDLYTPENIDAVAAALRDLKTQYKARRLIVLGHSGGAVTTAIVIGRHPGLIDVAMLISCPCDIVKWNQMIHRAAFTRSLLPMAYLDRVAPATDVVAMTGRDDGWTAPATVTGYVDGLKARGVDASFIPLPVNNHDFSPLWANGVKDELLAILNGRTS